MSYIISVTLTLFPKKIIISICFAYFFLIWQNILHDINNSRVTGDSKWLPLNPLDNNAQYTLILNAIDFQLPFRTNPQTLTLDLDLPQT